MITKTGNDLEKKDFGMELIPMAAMSTGLGAVSVADALAYSARRFAGNRDLERTRPENILKSHYKELGDALGYKDMAENLQVIPTFNPISSAAAPKELINQSDKTRKLFKTVLWGLEDNKDALVSSSNIAMDAHELGHLTNKWTRIPALNNIIRIGATPIGAAAQLLGGGVGAYANYKQELAKLRGEEPEHNVAKNIHRGTLAMGALPVLDEAITSARAINAIRKVYGNKLALKAIPPLAAALGTYATVPLASLGSGYIGTLAARGQHNMELDEQ